MGETASWWRRALRRVVPQPWRTALRRLNKVGFHPYPRHLFSRYRPRRQSLAGWLGYEAGFHWWRLTRGRGQRLERPIFLIGSPRSGTTIAVRLFGLHPDVVNLSEAADVWDPRRYHEADADHCWTATDVPPKEAARLHARFEYHRRRHQKPRFVNKHPRSSVRLESIRAVFPDAVFIHVIRDGRAVAASMVEFGRRHARREKGSMPLCHPPNWRELVREDKVEQVALQWSAIVRHVLGRKAELGPAYHEFRYEEMCEDPRGVIATAWRFAGLRVDEEILARLPGRLESQNFKWKQQLSLQQIETVTRVAGPLLKELGYSS